jgi:hypothetical protein
VASVKELKERCLLKKSLVGVEKMERVQKRAVRLIDFKRA